MAVYYILLVALLVLAIPMVLLQERTTIGGPNNARLLTFSKIGYLVLILGYLWALSTFRKGIGYDYQVYIAMAEEISGLSTFGELMRHAYEPGYVLLVKLITTFSSSSVVLYGVFAALTLIPIGIFIFRHCDDVWLSMWLFVTLAFFYNSMNFIRQSLACSIIVLGYGFLQKRKPIPFVLIALLAGSVHKTALIMIPIFFLLYIPLNKITISVFVALAGVTLALSDVILQTITRFVFGEYRGTRFIEQGFGGIYIVIPIVAIITCSALYVLWRKKDKDAELLLKLTMISTTLWIFSLRHMIIERFSMYSYIFVILAIPSAIHSLRPTPADVARHDELQTKLNENKPLRAEEKMEVKALEDSVVGGKQYYWSAVVVILFITYFYNNFGMKVHNFHSVFPYQSVLFK